MKYLFEWCYSRQYTCKSDESQVFFAGAGKIFFEDASLSCWTPCPPWYYTRKARDCQELFAAIGQIVFKSAAPIIVQYRSDCQVLFAQLGKINRLTSLCGCAILYQIEANLGQTVSNLRKFWQIRCKKHLTAAISYAAPRNKFMLGVWQKLFDIENRSLYNFYKSEELHERYSI